MALKRKPTGVYSLVWTGDEAFADNNAARIAKRRFWQDFDVAVFTPDTLKPGLTPVQFSMRHLSRGALDWIDTFMTPNLRKRAAFRAALVNVTGVTPPVVVQHMDAWAKNCLVETECWESLPFVDAVLNDLGEIALEMATFGEPEKKASPPPSGSPSSG